MTERICYKFGDYLLDPGRRSLLLNGNVAPLRPTAFDLLLVLVENHGKTLTKSEITKRVWGSDSGDDRKFQVTLHAVRQKLGDSAQTPRFIAREANGYRFVADVEQVAMGRDPAPSVLSLPSNFKDQVLDNVTPDETRGQDDRAPHRVEDGAASAPSPHLPVKTL